MIKNIEEVRYLIIKRVKNYTYPPEKIDVIGEKIQPADKISVFEDILRELKDIKNLLGNK